MKKAFLLLPLMLVGLAACGPKGGGETQKTLLKFDFTSATNGKEITAETAKTKFDGWKVEGDATYTVPEISKVYEGNGSGGARANQGQLVKFGTSSVNGKLSFTLDKKVKKVVLNCHSFYAKSDDYPENTSNGVKVNGSTVVALPYNETAAGEDMEFVVDSETVTIETVNMEDASKGGRGVFFTMTFIG